MAEKIISPGVFQNESDQSLVQRGIAGAGTNTAALSFGGGPPYVAYTETWNGTSWSQADELNTARAALGGAGTQASALGFGGETAPGVVTATEEFDDPSLSSKVVTAS